MKIHYNQESVIFAEFRLGYIAIRANGHISGDLSTRDIIAYDLCALLALADEVFHRCPCGAPSVDCGWCADCAEYAGGFEG